MQTRTKFIVEGITTTVNGSMITLKATTGGSPENDKFFKWTQVVQSQLVLLTKRLQNNFQPGSFFYVDFTKVTNAT